MSTSESSAALERDVEAERAALHRTLDQLRVNMQPARMAGELLTTVMGRRYEAPTPSAGAVTGKTLPESLLDLGAAVLFGSSMRALRRSAAAPVSSRPAAATVEDGLHAIGAEAAEARARISSQLDRADARATVATARLSDTIEAIRRDATGAPAPNRSFLLSIGTRANDAAARHTGTAAMVRTIVEKPVMMGVVGAAIGAAVGLSFAMSQTEDELMGTASDNFRKSARAMARERYDQVKQATNQAVEDFRQTVIDHPAG